MGGAGGIPWTAIDRYADRHDVEDFESFRTVLRALDGVYLEHLAEKMKPKKPGERNRAPRRKR